jgi:flagellar biosynthesis/type III secretory pathway M-ring protein FliF/YscJ
MLFDSVALGVSYLWLCCGILLVTGIPVVFVILWVVSNRRKREEQQQEGQQQEGPEQQEPEQEDPEHEEPQQEERQQEEL